MRDGKGRLIEVSNIDKGDVWFGQHAGIREVLLCEECEGCLSQLESHSVRLFTGPRPPHAAPSKRTREYLNLDYAKLKLFFLSVLWRSSVATDPFFKHVSLGRHENIIRDMLLQRNAGPLETYATMIFLLNHGGTHFRDFMVEPTPMRFEHRKCYCFVMAGFVIIISVSSLAPDERTRRLALSPNSPVRSYDAELQEFAFLRAVQERVSETTKDKII